MPSFAAQSGQPCTTCHVGGFGPQLTPFGRAFKIGGYTQRGGEGWRAQVPFAGMAIGSFTHTDSGQPNPLPGYGNNDNFNLDTVSGFLAGGFGEHVGAFVQLTSENNASTVRLDNTDIRPYTTLFSVLDDKDLRVGLTVNNSPTVQDPYNSTFAWGFPFVSSALAPTPAAQPVLAGAFANNAIGATAYAWYDRSLYLEAGGYNTSRDLLGLTGNDFVVGSTAGTAPYVRAAYEWNWNGQAAHVGMVYFETGVNPRTGPREAAAPFGHDDYADYAVDAGYQFLGDGTHIAMAQGIYTHESQNLAGTAGSFNTANGTAFGSRYHLDQVRINASYWYKNTYGVTFGWQRTWGPADPVLFAPAPVTGSRNAKPNSNAFIMEADWVPFGKQDSWAFPYLNLKFGVQYVAYTQFNGAGTNYDGFGRNASDNNTLFVFAWLAF